MDDTEIRHLAALARIRIEDNEIPVIAGNLQRVVQYVSEIQNVDIGEERLPQMEAGLAPPKHFAEAGELRNVMRDDVSPHAPEEYTEKILENVPDRAGNYVKVRKIL
ncbi:MAG: aspartyl/glutamyl-tRNA amidotransferase subunit C [Parcubacteria group bacterium]|nr:aspartyl/glutamyl-tRNA amidotransferase subunit C [Parcubacteria group bacterium]MBI3075059.1 aspartyl/glutamyl-tRNA amidotransferase subunit C [Parcubacteria group bacterium]